MTQGNLDAILDRVEMGRWQLLPIIINLFSKLTNFRLQNIYNTG